MKKVNKKERDNIIVYSIGIAMCTLFLSFTLDSVIGSAIYEHYKSGASPYGSYKNVDDIIEASKRAMSEMKYIDVFVEQTDNESYYHDDKLLSGHMSTYTYRTEKDSTASMYSYVDQNLDDSSIYEYWQRNEEVSEDAENAWDIWIWSTQDNSYVKVYNKEEPVHILTWDIFDNISKDSYKLDNSREFYWGEDEEPCYLIYTFGSNSQYSTIGEYIYISKVSGLPKGIITVGSKFFDDSIYYDEIDDISTGLIKVEKSEEELEDTDDYHYEMIMRYSYYWSYDDANKTVLIPENYIMGKEYEEVEDTESLYEEVSEVLQESLSVLEDEEGSSESLEDSSEG